MTIIRCLVKHSVVEALSIPDVFPSMVKLSVQRSLERCVNSHPLLLHHNCLIYRRCIPGLKCRIIDLQLPLVLILAVVYLYNALKATVYLRCARLRITLDTLPKLLCVMNVFLSFASLSTVCGKVCDVSPFPTISRRVATHEIDHRRH